MNDTESEFFSKLDAVNIYRKGNQRAPHKPLYILLLIASIQQGRPRLQKYTDIEPVLTEALNLFGLSNKKQNAHYPFWRLKNDRLAEISPQPDTISEKVTTIQQSRLL